MNDYEEAKPTICLKSEIRNIFSREQLALRNGSEKKEIWVAYKGVIYEVTHSRLWRDGRHYEHWAGQDLTEELQDAPHDSKVFEKLRIVGKLSL